MRLTDTRILYLLFILLVGLQRLFELRLSSRHARRLLAAGGIEAGRGHLPPMMLLHVLFLTACPLEVFLLHRPFLPWLAAVGGGLFVAAEALRAWAMVSLGSRWSVRVIALPGAPLVGRGPYRWLRHPNYLAVVAELIAIPAIHAAWLTMAIGGLLNAVLLSIRIRVEERLLREAAGDLPAAGRSGSA